MVKVFKSKQRPRTLTMIGSNGVDYQFLLKGHEDLRQDERAMQFFGLVNTLIKRNPNCAQDHLKIVTYSVVPLSPNAGLIGWVHHSDTFHQLVKEYREWKGIQLGQETVIMKDETPWYETITNVQKVEVFRVVLEKTDGMDMRNLMWRRSPNSEVWLQRRLAFTRSLAVMSMVGHILGIGDRHPSNLMLDRDTGDVAHIDFGDCFETAIVRSTFPERIPFRLTRMLINAMEASGLEGTFRLTCERVMALLRKAKDMLLTVLETFVYDPLLTWKLLDDSMAQNAASGNRSARPKGFEKYAAGSSLQSLRESILNKQDFILHVGETPQSGLFSGVGRNSLSQTTPTVSKLEKRAREGDEYAKLLLAIGKEIPSDDQPVQDVQPAPVQQPPVVTSYAESVAQHSEQQQQQDALNSRALKIMKRVTKKLDGREFTDAPLDVPAQVERLFREATNEENLASCYRGWCPFW